MTPTQALSLDVETYDKFWEAITILEAREMLVQLKVHTFIHLKSESQRRVHRYIMKTAFPDMFATAKKMTFDELQNQLASR